MKGYFFVLDGPDGCGKSTQAKLLSESLRRAGREVVHLREPGSTPFGEALRAVLLSSSLPRGAAAEVLTFFAARAQLMEECILPAVGRGAVIVCERFVSSTYAYQAAGLGGALELVKALDQLLLTRQPDLLLVLDIDEQAALARLQRERDDIESRSAEFHARVRQGFREYAAGRAFARCVDASGSRAQVHGRVIAEASRALGSQLAPAVEE